MEESKSVNLGCVRVAVDSDRCYSKEIRLLPKISLRWILFVPRLLPLGCLQYHPILLEFGLSDNGREQMKCRDNLAGTGAFGEKRLLCPSSH